MLLNIGHSVHCKGYTVYTVYLSEMGKNVCYGIKNNSFCDCECDNNTQF